MEVLKRWEYQTILPVSLETCMQVKKQQLETEIELTCFKLEKKVRKGYILSPTADSGVFGTRWGVTPARVPQLQPLSLACSQGV